MTAMATSQYRNAAESDYDRRTALVKNMLAQENAALDARTAKLRALRLAREAEASAEMTTPVKATGKRSKKKDSAN